MAITRDDVLLTWPEMLSAIDRAFMPGEKALRPQDCMALAQAKKLIGLLDEYCDGHWNHIRNPKPNVERKDCPMCMAAIRTLLGMGDATP